MRRPRRLRPVLLAGALVVVAGCILLLYALESGPQAGPAYLGVYERGTPASFQPVSEFAAATGKRPNVVLYYSRWGPGFPAKFAREARAHGAELIVQIQPTNISLAAIASGTYDGYLRSYAEEVRAFGYPVIIGFAHEMNADWYSWGTSHVPPATWVAAWRRIVTVFRANGTKNVTWLWTISHSGNSNLLRSYWPGASYVGWVGIDGYFERPADTYDSVFSSAISAVRTFTTKPILLSEVGAGPGTGRKAQDIAALFAGLRQQHLLGLVWFDVDQNDGVAHQDWRLEGNAPALAAFRRGASSFDLQHP